MMKLNDAAAFFDQTAFRDAYTGFPLFKGRILPFDDATRDSLSSERRLLSVPPGVRMPPRRCITTGHEVYMVGDRAVDYYAGDELRQKYILQQVAEKAQLFTFEAALTGTTPTKELYGSRLWVKGIKEIDESSHVYEAFNLYFALGEDIAVPGWQTGNYMDGREQNVLIKLEGRWHLVRSSVPTAGGFLSATVDELPEPVIVDVTATVRTYNPVPDTYTESTSTKKGVLLRWQSDFEYLTQYSEKYVPGDYHLKMLKSDVTAKAGDIMTIKDRRFKVVAVTDEAPVWAIHLRRD